MKRRSFAQLVLVLVLSSGVAWAQGNPTGTISGQVVDPDRLPLPGVTVSATSPVLQGERTVVTSTNGDYILPFLPPGSYTITFEVASFQTQRIEGVNVAIAETLPISVTMVLASLTETVIVTGSASAEITPTLTVATTYKAEMIDRLPVDRTLNAAVLLAPGVTDNGPNNNIMVSGAMSYENLFLINGVVVNENLRGQARNLFIEDAIQETKISTGSISAEYGRFQGGVVNMITKSGGNMFSGSVRVSFVNDGWSARTPYPGDENIDQVVPIYEMTAGGPILLDKLWFFGAGRFETNEDNRTLDYTAYNYTRIADEKRYEAKLSYAIAQPHTVKGAYTKRRLDTTNNSFGTVIDPKTFYDNANDENLYSLNYTGVLTSKWFVEGQYSRRELAFLGTGARVTDLAAGTPIWDRSRSQVRFQSPTFCAVCGSGVEIRSNWNALLKTNYFLSTEKTGSHNVVAGVDVYKETRQNDNYQSGSSYRVQATSAIIQGSTIYPLFRSGNTTYVEWLPLVAPSLGNDIRTYSFFLNDSWRWNSHVSFNAGLRYDRNNAKDQGGLQVVEDSAWSPRLGVTWDMKGDGRWIANAAFGRYVTGISTAIVDAGSAGGRTATFSYFYQGPDVNADPTRPLLAAEQALPILFDWFFANGGTSRATRTPPSIPGVTTSVGTGLVAPNSNEWTAGIARQVGGRGTVRADYIYRRYSDFYGDFRDLSTGKVSDTTGRSYDRIIVRNTNLANRTYKGVAAQASYRVAQSLQVGGNYTLSWQRGNFAGENVGSGPIRFTGNDQPEYRQERWNFPTGYNIGDQRHKIRAWLQYSLPVADRLGRFDLGLLQRFDTSDASSADGTIDPRPFVTNPGYISVPSTVDYFFGPRGDQRYDDVWRTDLSVVWEFPLRNLGGSDLFFRGIVSNLFNSAAVVSGNETIFTTTNNPNNFPFRTFNPFTETPVERVHYMFGPDYMRPTGPNDYQTPRELSFSVGFRF